MKKIKPGVVPNPCFSMATIIAALEEWYISQTNRTTMSCFMWPACHILYENLMVVMKKQGFGTTPGLIFFKKNDQLPLEYNDTAIPLTGRGIRVILHVFSEYKKWIEQVMEEAEETFDSPLASFEQMWKLSAARPQDVVLEESINFPPVETVPQVENKPLLAGASGRVELGCYVTKKFGLMPTVTLKFIQNPPLSENDIPGPSKLDER
ncbi:MAG: hypothetical protein H7836_18025, partial [Magnetococcus sp. YQC-3]